MTRIKFIAFLGLLAVATFGCKRKKAEDIQNQAEAGSRSSTVAGSDVAPNEEGSCSAKEADRQTVEYDTNGDQVPDVRKIYRRVSSPSGYNLVLLCREVDVNGDGRKDSIRYFSNQGVPVREEVDRNLDGKIDQIRHIQGSRPIRVLEDTNYDGVIDQRTYFRGGKAHRVERDTLGKSTKDNWKPNRWEYVEGGRTIRVGRDLNGNGQVDRWDRNEQLKAEDRNGG